MNTRWLKFREVLHAVAATQNLDVELGQLDSAVVQRRLVQAVNMAVDFAWKFHLWPEAAWLFAAGEQDDARTVFPLGFQVVGSFAEDPLARWQGGSSTLPAQAPALQRWREHGGRVVFETGRVVDTAFLQVRIPPPEFGVEARSASTAYGEGELVYDAATGECWRCQKAHTNAAPPAAWTYWSPETAYAADARVWRGGWLFKSKGTYAPADYAEPAGGTGWAGKWNHTTEEWCPVRLPQYLLRAVLAGARAWLDSPDTEAMERAMEGALSTEIHDRVYTRKQGTATKPAGPRF